MRTVIINEHCLSTYKKIPQEIIQIKGVEPDVLELLIEFAYTSQLEGKSHIFYQTKEIHSRTLQS